MDIDTVMYVLSNIINIHSVGRILEINGKIQIIKHLKSNFNSVFNGISLIIKIYFTNTKGIYESKPL